MTRHRERSAESAVLQDSTWGQKVRSVSVPQDNCYKVSQTGSLNNRNTFPHRSGGWKAGVEVWTGWFLPRPHSLASSEPFTGLPSVCIRGLVSSAHKDTGILGWGK